VQRRSVIVNVSRIRYPTYLHIVLSLHFNLIYWIKHICHPYSEIVHPGQNNWKHQCGRPTPLISSSLTTLQARTLILRLMADAHTQPWTHALPFRVILVFKTYIYLLLASLLSHITIPSCGWSLMRSAYWSLCDNLLLRFTSSPGMKLRDDESSSVGVKARGNIWLPVERNFFFLFRKYLGSKEIIHSCNYCVGFEATEQKCLSRCKERKFIFSRTKTQQAHLLKSHCNPFKSYQTCEVPTLPLQWECATKHIRNQGPRWFAANSNSAGVTKSHL